MWMDVLVAPCGWLIVWVSTLLTNDVVFHKRIGMLSKRLLMPDVIDF